MRRIVSKPEKKEQLPIEFQNCLAKTESIDGMILPGMTVLEHCMLTGYVAVYLAKAFPCLCKAGFIGSYAPHIAALHDIGKISPSFQKKIATALSPGGIAEKLEQELHLECDFPDIRHDEISEAALKDIAGKPCAQIAGLHHGGLPTAPGLPDDGQYGGRPWQAARERLAMEIDRVFNADIPRSMPSAQTRMLAGFTVVSDWLSSSISNDAYAADGISAAEDAVRDAGFCIHRYRKHLGFRDIFGFAPRPEQQEVIDIYSGPGIYMIEAEMGSGKTEAAFYLAYRLLEDGLADGIYFALPTTVTSRSMYARFAAFVDRILENGHMPPKLAYAGSELASYGDMVPGRDWFDFRKRILLAPFGVGTIDQALLAILNVRHSAVRAFGLAGKAVILDEVHSYDAYTGCLIADLVRMLRGLGATVIILSATLRTAAKKELMMIADGRAISEAYPCISVSSDGQLKEKAAGISRRRTVIVRHEEDDDIAAENALDYALSGRYVLWIENDVMTAQRKFMVFSSRLEGTSVRVGLLHSRMAGMDRERHEGTWISIFGKEGISNRNHGEGCILVGTQVLEQSLDIDSDVLFTRLAPIDMLMQRIGRLWRHGISGRNGKPCVHVLHPNLEKVIRGDSSFGISGAV